MSYDELWQRRQYTALFNGVTGQKVIVDEFSKRLYKMRGNIFAWADVITDFLDARPAYRMVMVTLTYRGVRDYQPGHIGEYMRKVRYLLKGQLLAFCWIAEMQKRGAVHYHVLLVVPKGYIKLPSPDKSGMWPYGRSRIETARTAYYICSYTGKEYQKDFSKFPKGCRTYAMQIYDKELKSAFEVQREKRLAAPEREESEAAGSWYHVASTVTYGYAELLLDRESVVEKKK